MLHKLLLFTLILLLAGSALKAAAFSRPVLASPVVVEEEIAQTILGATVRISMYAPLTDEQDNIQYVRENGKKAIQLTVNDGLGTLTRRGDELFIITHDHWLLLNPDSAASLLRVEIHDVEQNLLLQLSGEQFMRLISYRDGGTMVLTAPDELADLLTAVAPGDSTSTGRSDIVYLAYREPYEGQINVVAMLVQKETTYKGQPVYRLTSLNGEVVVEGNSGGGVLYNGKLIGNMWGTIMVEDLSAAGASSPQQSSFSLAAQLPAEIGSQRSS
jgi:hypothetical protein